MYRWVYLAVGVVAIVVAIGLLGWYLYDLRSILKNGSSKADCPCSAIEAPAEPATKTVTVVETVKTACKCEPPVVIVNACGCNAPAVEVCECEARPFTQSVVVDVGVLERPNPAPFFAPCQTIVPVPVTVPVTAACGCGDSVCPPLNGRRAEFTFTGTCLDPSLRWQGCRESGWVLDTKDGRKTVIYP